MRVGVDWFEPSFVGVDVAEIEEVLTSYVGGEFIDLPHGAPGYAHARLGPLGARVMFDERRPEVHVQLKGEWCGALDEPSMRGFLLWSRSRVTHVSRLDLYGDDELKRIMPADLVSVVREGHQLVTKTKNRHCDEDLSLAAGMRLADDEWGRMVGVPGAPGTTMYFGAGQSRRLLRVYDKGAESRGRRDVIRWELQARDEVAGALLEVLPTEKAWGQVWADAITGFVDFRDRTVSGETSRCPRMPWFAALVEDVERWRPYPAEPPRTIEQVFDYQGRINGPSLNMLLEAAEGDVSILEELALAGRGRLSARQRAMLAEYRARGSEVTS